MLPFSHSTSATFQLFCLVYLSLFSACLSLKTACSRNPGLQWYKAVYLYTLSKWPGRDEKVNDSSLDELEKI